MIGCPVRDVTCQFSIDGRHRNCFIRHVHSPLSNSEFLPVKHASYLLKGINTHVPTTLLSDFKTVSAGYWTHHSIHFKVEKYGFPTSKYLGIIVPIELRISFASAFFSS